MRIHEGEASILVLQKSHKESNIFLYKIIFNNRNLVKFLQMFYIHTTQGESSLDLKHSIDKRINS